MISFISVYHYHERPHGNRVVGGGISVATSLYFLHHNWVWMDFDNFTDYFIVLFLICSGAVSLFYFFRHWPYFFETEFLRVVNDGLVFRNLGFIPWQNIRRISVNDEGLVFQLDEPETIHISQNFFRRVIRRSDGQVLMSLLSKKMEVYASPEEIVQDLKVYYVAYLEPTRGYGKDTPADVIEKRLAEEKRGIRFFEPYVDIAASFNPA